ncbi:MAG: amino acid ABC transporter permease [Alphaproteobacteria bacterium]|nr:amino acid ABC transporter permease [Alphaproteobacteria bacterium]
MNSPPLAEAFVLAHPAPARAAPAARRTPVWRTLFGDAVSSGITLAALAGLLELGPKLVSWGLVRAAWSGPGTACGGQGACWAFLRSKAPFILFGIYPPEQRWRPAAMVAMFVLLALWTLPPSRWTRLTLWLWAGAVAVAVLLMSGGVLGLTPVPTSAWGGLPVTVLLTVLSLAIGFPLGVALALGRRSELPGLRWMSIAVIELVRGLPLVTILFIAAILLPLMLPDGVKLDNLARALAALTVFSAAYLAEVLRGGLQGVGAGQAEAGRALGLSWWATTRLIVLPQAVGNVIPALTNTVVVIVKNTSLVLLVGLFDLLSAGRAALTDPKWPGPYMETYGFVALIYFVICFSISRYALWLERRPAFGASS